jgi:hypothetical protein
MFWHWNNGLVLIGVIALVIFWELALEWFCKKANKTKRKWANVETFTKKEQPYS